MTKILPSIKWISVSGNSTISELSSQGNNASLDLSVSIHGPTEIKMKKKILYHFFTWHMQSCISTIFCIFSWISILSIQYILTVSVSSCSYIYVCVNLSQLNFWIKIKLHAWLLIISSYIYMYRPIHQNHLIIHVNS